MDTNLPKQIKCNLMRAVNMMVNTVNSQQNTQDTTQSELETNSSRFTAQAKQGLLKMTLVYSVSFLFWVVLWLLNDGLGGMEVGMLGFAAIGHLVMIAIHYKQAVEASAADKN